MSQMQALQNHRHWNREKLGFFCCKRCLNQWPSGKAQVIFYYPNENQPLGKITMQICGQQCRKCSYKNGSYADPIFPRHIIVQILEKLHEQINCDCYNKPRPLKERNSEANKDDSYDPMGEHESDLCEACKLKICSYTKPKTHRYSSIKIKS